MLVPVLDKNNQPLMPTLPSKAKRWIKLGNATPFWKKGIFCIRLNAEPSDTKKQKIVCGIDPGSKREAYTVSTEKEVVLNILTDTPNWVKEAKKTQKEMRRGRRFRKAPCRKPRYNNLRNTNRLAPSTKARWQAKLRILDWVSKSLPITDVIVEDVKAKSWKNAKRWNTSFSPLEVGKEWFYQEVEKKFNLTAVGGYDTKRQRDERGFTKSSKKLDDTWNAHNVDSHCLCELLLKKVIEPIKRILRVSFLQFHRRMLHRLQPKDGERKRYGGTMSLGLKRGSLIKHLKYGLCFVGGFMKERLSLHSLKSGKRLCQNAKVEECVFKTYLSWSFNTISPHS